jgi:hypothetical protein
VIIVGAGQKYVHQPSASIHERRADS